MTEALVKVALLGTARSGEAPVETGTELDRLLAGLPAGGRERTLLLVAGAWAAYRQAGRAAERAPEAGVAPAPEESLPVCSPGAARLVEEMLRGEHADLLPEALERLRRAGQRLPPGLLPAALDARPEALRPALLSVLGERGRWLAQFNPAWHWVAETFAVGDESLPANAETLWQEGTPAQRLEVLRRVRVADPARGREWLAGAWKAEKADYRKSLLETLETGLGGEDEPFLEAALDDRSAAVRKAAASLLARIPGSVLLLRMTARADALLDCVPVPSFIRQTIGGTPIKVGRLSITPPSIPDKDWQRDGIDVKPPQGTGQQSWWLTQVLAFIPPSYWSDRFGVEPLKLMNTFEISEWKQPVVEGWTYGAILHNDSQWLAPLWQWWYQYRPDEDHATGPHHDRDDRDRVVEILGTLTCRMQQSDAERLVVQMLGSVEQGLDSILSNLPVLNQAAFFEVLASFLGWMRWGSWGQP